MAKLMSVTVFVAKDRHQHRYSQLALVESHKTIV